MSDDHFDDFPEDNPLTRSSLGHAPSTQQSSLPKNINKDKLQTFQSGFRKKTAFERQKEELEEKKRREEEEAAKVYADFVASFEEPDPGEKIFLRGKSLVPSGTKLEEVNDIDSKDRIFRGYLPGSSEKRALLDDHDKDNLAYQPEEPKPSNPLKRRKMDEFMSKLKKKHEEAAEEPIKKIPVPVAREPMLPYSAISTNVYVGNLHPKVDEDFLCREFAKFGPIASVKVMWPRSAEELARGRNSGFVCFMDRASAQRAMHGMQGKEFFGQTVRLDWGKPVALPAKPYFVLDKFLPKPVASTSSNEDGTNSISKPISASEINISETDGSASKDAVKSTKETEGSTGEIQSLEDPSSTTSDTTAAPTIPVRPPDEEIHVVIPDNKEVLRLIHRTIEFVLEYGHGFEEAIVSKHKENASFLFLHDLNHPYHHYYRWKLYSLLQGDDIDDWRIRPFRMVSQGPYWIPPPCPKRSEREWMEENDKRLCLERQQVEEDETLPSSDSDLENEHYSRHASKRVLRRLRTLCSHLGIDRYSIARTMAFCIDASESAMDMSAEVASILQRSESSSHQLHLLYLVHDVLHNCTAPVVNAWRYRDAFQHQLPDMLKHMSQTYLHLRIESRWKAEGWRTEVLSIVALWRHSMLYPRDFLMQLETLFRSPEESQASMEASKEDSAVGSNPITTTSTTSTTNALASLSSSSSSSSSPYFSTTTTTLTSTTPPSQTLDEVKPAPTILVTKPVEIESKVEAKPFATPALAFGFKSARTSAPKSSVFKEEDDENDVH